ncbi:MAG: DUF2993 domain-containing protein [Cyanobacteria bacterium P01_A01_bin.114]
MGSPGLDIGEEAISNAAKSLIASQLDTYDTLEIEVRTDPLKLTQGQIDSLILKGEGLVVQKDLRTASLMLETGAVDVSMTKMLAGKMALDEPATATANIVLTPEDIQAAFNGDYIRTKMRGTKAELASGEQVTTDVRDVSFSIPETGRILVAANVLVIENADIHQVEFSASPQLVKDGYGIALEEIQYADETNDTPALTRALIDSTQALLDFRSFDLGEMTLQFTQLEVQPDKMTFQANAHIESFG